MECKTKLRFFYIYFLKQKKNIFVDSCCFDMQYHLVGKLLVHDPARACPAAEVLRSASTGDRPRDLCCAHLRCWSGSRAESALGHAVSL